LGHELPCRRHRPATTTTTAAATTTASTAAKAESLLQIALQPLKLLSKLS
jgi:hypothetical protein